MISRNSGGLIAASLLICLLVSSGCASGGSDGGPLPPSASGTHTVMGRAMFPGGTMVLVEAALREGVASGRVEYSQVQSRRETTLRVEMEVACVGIFREGTQAVVTGPVTRADGDYEGLIGARDWWFVQIREGGSEGDLIRSGRIQRARGLDLCHGGPDQTETLRAVDGDLSIH